MYKIYINETPLIIANCKNIFETEDATIETYFPHKTKLLINYIDSLERNSVNRTIRFCTEKPTTDFKKFQSLFKIIPAAGGIIENEKGEILLIYRLNKWDLPKGKVERGESIEKAASREIHEEIGIKVNNLSPVNIVTYHTYKILKERILKPTTWFQATVNSNEISIVLQTEEGIEDFQWLKPEDFFTNADLDTYGSLRDLIIRLYS